MIPLVEGKNGRASVARAELEISNLRDIVVAMKKHTQTAARVSRTSRFSEDRLSLH